MRLAVVGVGGVGMAHVVAARRAGLDVVALVDRDEGILARARQDWSNQWLDVYERADPQPDTQYLYSAIDLPLAVDLTVIATPPDTHNTVLAACLWATKGRVLLEKPVSYPGVPLPLSKTEDVRVSVSGEWVHHTGVQTFHDPLVSLTMAFPEAHTTAWKTPLPMALDFMPHLLSIIRAKHYWVDDIVRLDAETYLVHTSGGPIECHLRRTPPYGLWLNDTRLDWQDNLFDLQLLAGRGPLGYREACHYESLLLARR
jgi:hypothetical protein